MYLDKNQKTVVVTAPDHLNIPLFFCGYGWWFFSGLAPGG
jgi:hypothetical protein